MQPAITFTTGGSGLSEGPDVQRLILWDIDGTLIRGGAPAREVIEDAAARVAGLEAVPDVEMSGKTDPQILREILTLAGVPQGEADRLLPSALAVLEDNLRGAVPRLRAEGRVLPGVVELLRGLGATAGVHQTVVSGNLAANAYVKLAAFGLDDLVDTEAGAYGSDNPDRNTLVQLALERVAALRKLTYERAEVWVVGDTPHDLACARAAGVRCLLVGTGRVGFEGVRDVGADAVLADLSATDEPVGILLG